MGIAGDTDTTASASGLVSRSDDVVVPGRRARRRIERTPVWPVAVAALLASSVVVVGQTLEPDPAADGDTELSAPATGPATGDAPTASLRSDGVQVTLDGRRATIATASATGASGAIVLTTRRVADLVPDAGTIASGPDRISRTSDAVTEWYRTTAGGLEHGYTIDEPVSDAPVLEIELGVVGGVPVPTGADVTIIRPDAPPLSYRGLHAHDADGDALSARLTVEGDAIVLRVDVADAEYPVTVDPVIAEDQQVAPPAIVPGGESVRLAPSAGGGVASAVCLTGDALTGLTVYRSSQGGWLRAFEVRCTPIAISGGDLVVQTGAEYVGAAFGDPTGGGSPFPTIEPATVSACPAGSVVTGVRGRTGALVDSIQLECRVLQPDGTLGATTELTEVGVTTNPLSAWLRCAEGSVGLVGRAGTDVDQVGLACGSFVATSQARFGTSIDVDGDRMVVGAPGDDVADVDTGAVYVYERTGAGQPWTLDAVLAYPDGLGYTPDLSFGSSVAVRGDQIAVGDPDNVEQGEPGRVWLFTRVGPGNWGSPVRIDSSNVSSDGFGTSIDFLGPDRLVIGAPFEIGDPGRVYEWSSGTLTDRTPGGIATADDELGFAVAASPRPGGGVRVVAGAPGKNGDEGALYIFEDTGGGSLAWQRTFSGYTPAGRRVGTGVDVFRDRIVVGEYGDGTPTAAYRVLLYETLDGGANWSDSELFSESLGDTVTNRINDYVDIEDGTIVAGNPGNGGRVDVFRTDGAAWSSTPVDVLVPGGREPGDRIGSAVSLDGRTLVTGAPGDDGVADASPDSGAAYSAEIPITATARGGGAWGLPTSWDAGVVPGADDTAIVAAGALTTVVAGDDVEIGQLHVAGQLTVDGRLRDLGTGTPSRVPAGGILTVGDTGRFDPTGVLTIDGTLAVADGAEVVADGALLLGGSGLVAHDGTVTKSGNSSMFIGAGLEWNTTPSSSLEVDSGAIVVNVNQFAVRGRLAAAAQGSFTFNSGIALDPSAVVEVEIDGPPTNPGNFGRVVVGDGVTTIDGTLRAVVPETYTPVAGDVYPVIECAPDCFSGGFDVYETAPFDAIVDPTVISLSVLGNKILSDTSGRNRFGYAVDVDGDWAVVGERNTASSPSGVHVLRRDPTTGDWATVQSLLFPIALRGSDVAIDGEYLAYTSPADNTTFVARRDPVTQLFSVLDSVPGSGAVDIHDGVMLVGNPVVGNATAWNLSPAGAGLQRTLAPDGGPVATFGRSVAVGGDFGADDGIAVIGAPTDVLPGTAYMFATAGGILEPTPFAERTSPDGGLPNAEFGNAVAVSADGRTIVIGERLNSEPQPDFIHAGAAWVYRADDGYDSAEKLVASDREGSDVFGSSVAIDGSTIVVGAGAAQKTGYPIRDGKAYVYQRVGGTWVETGGLRAPDGLNGERFGDAVAISGTDILVGAPEDLNTNGAFAGAVYAFGTPLPPDPTLALSISTSDPTPTVGVSSIDITDLPASAFQGYGGTTADYAAASLQTLDLRADLGAPNAATTPVADVTLGQLALDTTPVTRRLLGSILLPEVPIEGGWSARLQPNGGPLLVEQSITLLDVYQRYPTVADAVALRELVLDTTNLGSISTYAALLAGVSVTEFPSPDGGTDPLAYWCGVVAAAGLSCATDFGVDPLTGAGADALTLPVLSFAGIDIDSSELLGVLLTDVDLTGTPIGGVSLGDLNLGLVPLASQPLVPSKSLPSYLPATTGVPAEFSTITIGELGGAAPLAALEPVDLGLAGVPVTTDPDAPRNGPALDLTHRPSSPLQDYLWSPPATGAALLLSFEGDGDPANGLELPADVAAIPVADLGLNAPVLSVPLDQLVLPDGRALADVRLVDLLATSSPFGASPFGASPFGASPFGASPFGASPFGASPFGASPFGASPFGASPFGASPFGASPFGASPFGASSLSELGLAAPVTAIPLTSTASNLRLGDYALADLDPANLLFDLPIAAFVGDPPNGPPLLDCALIDCRQPNGFTIGDAIAAGALSDTLTLADVQPGLLGLTVGDLVGAHPDLTEAALSAYVASLTLTIADAEALGLGVTGIPIQLLDVYDTVTIGQARLLFSGWRLVDLAGLAVGLERADLDAAVARWASATTGQPLTVGDLTFKLPTTDVTGLGDALWVDTLAVSTLAEAASLTVDDVWPLLRPLRLEHLRLTNDAPITPTGTAATTIGTILATAPALPAPQPLEGLLWGDVVGSAGTDPIPAAADLTVADIVDGFAGVTLGEFLRAAQPIADQPTERIDLDSVDLAAYSTGPAVTFDIDVEIVDGFRPDGIRVVATLPIGSRYVEGSAQLLGGPSPVDLAPTLLGDTLVWQLANVQPDVPYTIRFATRSEPRIGPVVAGASAQLASANVFARAATTLEYVEAFEPNDLPGDAGVFDLGPDQIVLSQIGSSTDVDLFRFTVDTPGTLIGGELWDLPADYDLTIIGPSVEPLSPTGGRELESVGDSRAPVTGGTAATLSDGGNYQPPPGLSVIARSTGRGTSDESIEPIPTYVVGTYYLVVSGYDGAASRDSYAARLVREVPPLAAPVCPNPTSFPFAGDGVDAQLAPLPAGVNTLFVINHERFGDQYGAQAAADVLAAIDDLTAALATPNAQGGLADLGLVAGTVDLGAAPGPAVPYDQWDAVPCELGRANDVVRATISELAAIYAQHPGIEHVVIVGSDKIVPFARLSDRTVLGNEQSYATTFADDLSTPLYAALAAGTFFSDDPFVDTTPNLVNDRALYVAERSIGRLVEDPAAIVGQLDGFVARDGLVRVDSALISGYEFMTDSATAISDRLGSDATDGFPGPVPQAGVVELISDQWDAEDLRQLLFPANDAASGIGLVNGHFSHQGTQSALGSVNEDQTDALFVADAATTDFAGSLIYTLGCHSGLSVSEDVTGPLGADWAETFARQGAAAYLAQTGFGYGATESIQLTEQLLVLFSDRLDGNFTLGEALQLAKNDYVAPLSSISVYDEKTVQQAVLFGLPFARPDVGDPPARPPAPPTLDLVETGVPGLTTATIAPTFEIERVDDPAVPSRGTRFEIDGRSYAPQEFPLQPITTVDTTGPDGNGDGIPDARLHGAILRSGSAYLVDGLIDPVYQTPTIDSSANEPELQRANARYPISPLGVTDRLTEFGTRDSTVIIPGRFTATQADGRGVQALYDDLTIQTLHSGSSDWSAPTVGTVRQRVVAGVLTVTVTTPSPDVAGVVVAVVEDLSAATETAPASWRAFDLATSGAGRWTGGIPLTSSCTQALEYLVQIYDAAGNVRVMSNKASGFASPCVDDEPPPVDPALTASPSAANRDASGWYTGPVTVEVATTLAGPLAYSIDGGPSTPLTGSSFQIVGDGIRTYAVTATGSTLVAGGTVLIDAAGLAPVVTIASPTGDVQQGRPVSILYSCADVSLVSCEGTLVGPDGLARSIASGTVLTPVAGAYELTVVADDAVTTTGPTTERFAFEARYQPPSIVSITGPVAPAQIGSTTTIEVVFDDPDLESDDYTVTFDWGRTLTDQQVAAPCVATSTSPGTTSVSTCSLVEPVAGRSGVATGSIVYPAPGVYTVTVTVTDAGGLSASDEYTFVVIFDPAGGRVTGAGQYWSPAESYFGDGPVGGAKTTFGYNARYQANSTTPKGQTHINVHKGLRFQSDGYDYLVVNDTIAVAEGYGEVNGRGGYRMRVQGIDNGKVDFFQITIWDPATNEVLYDNGVLYDYGAEITSGNIQVKP